MSLETSDSLQRYSQGSTHLLGPPLTKTQSGFRTATLVLLLVASKRIFQKSGLGKTRAWGIFRWKRDHQLGLVLSRSSGGQCSPDYLLWCLFLVLFFSNLHFHLSSLFQMEKDCESTQRAQLNLYLLQGTYYPAYLQDRASQWCRFSRCLKNTLL